MIERYERLGSSTCRVRWNGVEGAPVVLVHGLGGSADNWNLLIEHLPDTNAVALDLPGFGFSSPADRHTLAMHAATVAELITNLGDGRVTLVGNSMGGLIAAIVARDNHQLVERLVLVSPATPVPSLGDVEDPLVTLRLGAQALPWVGTALIRRWQQTRTPEEQVAEKFQIVARYPDRIPATVIERAVEIARARQRMPWAARAFSESALSVGAKLANRNAFRRMIAGISQPTVLIWGAEDRVVSPAAVDWLAGLRPDWHHVRLDDTGHVPMVEAPELVAGLITDIAVVT